MGKVIPVTYDARQISPYFGRTFHTSIAQYHITPDGRIKGRRNLDGAEIGMLAGVQEKNISSLTTLLDSDYGLENKHLFDQVFSEYARKPEIGLALVVSLTDKHFKKFKQIGMITSPIISIS